jgi:iron(III) transport system ATP-binding protein
MADLIRLEEVSKSFSTRDGFVHAVRAVNLEIEPGEFFVFLGPSGSGKTTLLRCVAGLEKPDSGAIRLGGRPVFSAEDRLFIPPEERELGMVFQSYAIWPHLTVFDNVALPLTQGRGRWSRAQVREKVREALRLVEMEDFQDRPAPLLSGGQQQRVALARALAVNPKALLMDEPLSNLDARLREEVRTKLKGLVSRLGITVLYVTHDQVEAMVLADRIAVMAQGMILQVGSPYELYRSPLNPQVAEFFGSINWLEGKWIGRRGVETEIGVIELDHQAQGSGAVVLGIRPEDLRIGSSPTTSDNELEGEIVSKTFVGDQMLFEVRVKAKTLFARTMSDNDAAGEKVFVYFPRRKIIVFPQTASFAGQESY